MNRTFSIGIGFIFFTLFGANLHSSEQAKIGYGSSDAVLPAKNQELFFMGFEAGFKKMVSEKTAGEILIAEQVADGSPLGAMRSAESLIGRGAVALVGFPTSHEALLASKIALQHGVLAVFSGAGHADLAKLGSLIFTTGESMRYSVESSLAFIKKYFPKGEGVLITNPSAVFSKNQEDTFVDLMKGQQYSGIKMISMQLGRDLKLSEGDVQRLKNIKKGYLCLTPYADESVRLLEQLEKEKLDLPILSNSSWTTGDIEFLRRFLTNRKAPVYSATLWLKGSPESKNFENLIRQRYGREPTAEMAYGYDLGVIIGQTLNAVKGPLTQKSIAEAFRRIRCFDGVTSGKICFKPEGGHAERKITFVAFTKKGFIPADAK